MAQYKVPQDVEADDKLLGPFTFRQFVYLMIMGGFIGLAFALFQIFPLLALLAVPFVIFFAVLALPLKKDQPMETYLAAIVSYHLKPNKRFWNPGQRESTIQITAPKKVEQPRARDITEEEAGNRLSFLANVIDTEGYAVRGDLNNAPMREKFLAEADATPDFMDINSSPVINQMLAKQQTNRHRQLVNDMRAAISRTEAVNTAIATPAYTSSGVNLAPLSASQPSNTSPQTPLTPPQTSPAYSAGFSPSAPVTAQPSPASPIAAPLPPQAQVAQPASIPASSTPLPPSSSPLIQPQSDQKLQSKLKDLAKNNDFSIATLSKEANRLEQKEKKKKEKEVYVSLH